ncbi:ribosomal RNA processing protein 1 homolog B isoform X2 [Pelodiscus sinensis]|uniref:ribosomal RNA processing protein 1 homolog B isoform X2 n=1 Tax=Pelodiscus sinensis TaxID=13735 RepID=UPI003F6CD963
MERVSRFQRAGGRDAVYPAEGGGAKGDGGAGTMAPAAATAAVQPPEIQFAQRLAANEKRNRDRAVKKLRGYISLRTRSPAGGFSQEELLKIWKGLFYCMWMQDKPLLQEELASTISQLIHVIQNIEAQHLFIQTFWQTMNREWNGIDRLRLDKYYMLIRMVLRQSFEVLKRNGWDESLIGPFLHLLMKEVIHPESNAPNGIKFHFIDIYLEELAKVGAKELTADQNLKFIEPFCKIAAKSKDRHLMQAVARGIFEAIVDQSPFAIEDLMKELKTSCDDHVELSEEDEDENKEPLMTKDKHLSRKSALGFEEQKDLSENTDENIGPVLQFNYKAVANRLFELASRKNTPAFNRKRLYKLVKKFQGLAEGIFPQDDFPEDVSTDEDDDTFSRGRRKRKVVKPVEKAKLEKEKEKDGKEAPSAEGNDAPGRQKKRKRRKKRDCQIANSSTPDGRSEQGVCDAVEPNKGRASETNKRKRKTKSLDREPTETGIGATGSGGGGDNCAQDALTHIIQNKRTQLKKKNTKLQKVPVNPVSQNGPTNASALQDGSDCAPLTTTKMVKKKQKIGTVLLNGSGLSEQAALQSEGESLQNSLKGEGDSESTPTQKVKLKKKPKLGSSEGLKVSNQKPASLKKKRKIKEEVGGTLTLIKKKKAKTENDFVKFEKTTLPKPVFFRKAKGSISSTRASMQLNKLQGSSSKKVTFGLNKNMTAEFKKTDKSILVSPEGASRVAFNPEQKPPHGVLKSPGAPTGEPQLKKSFVTPAKKRPTAMDFF